MSADTGLSLRGKITINDLGTRVEKTTPFSEPRKQRPRTDSYSKLLAYIYGFLSDVPDSTLESASEMILAIVQNDTLSPTEKQEQISSILGPVSSDELGKIFALIGALKTEDSESDFDDEQEESESESDGSDPGSESEAEDIQAPEWTTNTRFLQQLLDPTGIKVPSVLEALACEDPESQLLQLFNNEFLDVIEVLLKNPQQLLWYTKLLNADTGPERDAALEEIKRRGLEPQSNPASLETIDLDTLVPSTNSRFAASPSLELPEGTEKSVHGSYEQYTLPIVQNTQHNETLVETSTLPPWAHSAFEGIEFLNPVQSSVYESAFNSSGNLLLCAPTGAGKTNVALLCILNCLRAHKLENGFDLEKFKIVYISPLKALVQEQVRTFSQRLGSIGLTVTELTGDNNLTSDQIATTQVIITTPEKWDVITRKSFDVAYTSLVKLVIMDEIHLLHDPRGPALENIVARSHLLDQNTRLVGLSATLPNFKDVATFLKAEHVYYFDSTYRPCPLKQTFVGITEKSAFKRHNALNEICYEKVKSYVDHHQSIVFVHSRKDTAKTASFIIDKAIAESLGHFSRSLQIDESTVRDSTLKNLLPHGIGIHHAGLSKQDRSLVEQLFAEHKLKVLVSTATLAWGVNLPAHAVIIKGTQVYTPQNGQWEELSPQDILQMLGRAGRPGFDSFGEGVVITLHDQLAYYMSILTSQFPIESQMITRLTDSLNAEVSLGTVKSLKDAIKWLGFTYYFVRMKQAPSRYRAGIDYDSDGEYIYRRRTIVHSALKYLHKIGMVEYDGSDNVNPTDKGHIAAKFYISPSSMAVYTKQLKPHYTAIDIFRVFARSKEFENIPIRPEEKVEVQRLANLVPIPIKDELNNPSAKICCLLQAYIGGFSLEGLALSTDLVYITQSASRLFRAMFELALVSKWSALALQLHDLFLMVDKRMWYTSSPFRQFTNCPPEILRSTENSPMPWERYFDLESPQEVAQVLRSEKYAETTYDLLQKFPRVKVTALHQTLTASLLRLSIEVEPQFHWDRSIHSRSQSFLVFVSDGDNEKILHFEWLLMTENHASNSIAIQMTVPLEDPLPSAYFINVINDSWLHSTTTCAVDLGALIIPAKVSPPTEVKYMDNVDISHIEFPLSSKTLNLMQSQVFDTLYSSDKNCFVGMSRSCGSNLLSELVFARHHEEPGVVLYMNPDEREARSLYYSWSSLNMDVGILSGDLAHDLQTLAKNKIVVTSAKTMDLLSRKWQSYKHIQTINVIIIDNAHLIGSTDGHIIERVLIRLKFMSTQLDLPIRYVGLSYPVAGSELGKWLGATKSNIFNFHPKDRPACPILSVESFGQREYKSRQQMMIERASNLLKGMKTLIFLSSRDECILAASQIVHSGLKPFDIDCHDKTLQKCCRLGVPFVYSSMHPEDHSAVLALDAEILLTYDAPYGLPKFDQVIVLNTQFYDYKEGYWNDYTAVQVIGMLELARERAVVLSTVGKAAYYDQFIREPLPIESHLMYYLADTVMVECAEHVIVSAEACMDWLTYSFFFHRLRSNPTYYGLESDDDDTINEYLSELIESTVEELSNEDIVEVTDEDEMAMVPLNGAFIGSVYGLSIGTVSLFNSLSSASKLEDILRCICQANEFWFINVDKKEYETLIKLQKHLPFSAREGTRLETKVFILLQAHLSRVVPAHSRSDLEALLKISLQCALAIIDILSGKGFLNALIAVDLHQMLMQGQWDKDSSLKQIPHVDKYTVLRADGAAIYSIGDFLSIEDDEVRNSVLGFTEEDPRMVDVADFCNRFPGIDILPLRPLCISSEEEIVLDVTIEREIDDDEEVDTTVMARFKSLNRAETWYLIVGSIEARELYGAKKITLVESQSTFRVPLQLDTIGQHKLNVWCVCTGYIDADKEAEVTVTIE